MSLAPLPRPEAVFRLDDHTLLPPEADDALRIYLARRVKAVPGDLLNHTRRVLLGRREKNGPMLFSALVDLFIATGSRGQALKRRLLDLSAALLTPLQRQFLEKNSTTGLAAAVNFSADYAVLTSGATSKRLLTRH